MWFERLKEERKRLGFKQKNLAELLGLASQTFLQYEKGIRSPNAELFEKLSSLGFDMGYIFMGGERACDNAKEALHRRLVTMFDSASAEIQNAVIAMLESASSGGNVFVQNNVMHKSNINIK